MGSRMLESVAGSQILVKVMFGMCLHRSDVATHKKNADSSLLESVALNFCTDRQLAALHFLFETGYKSACTFIFETLDEDIQNMYSTCTRSRL